MNHKRRNSAKPLWDRQTAELWNQTTGNWTRLALFLDVPKASVTAQNEGSRYKLTTLTFPMFLDLVRGKEALLVELRSPSFQPVRQKHADVFPPRL